jgi:hypothetical protein
MSEVVEWLLLLLLWGRGVKHPSHLDPRLKKEYSYTFTPSLGIRGLFWSELCIVIIIIIIIIIIMGTWR